MAAKFAQKEILPLRDQFETDYAEGRLVDKILLEAAKIGLLGFPIDERLVGRSPRWECMPIATPMSSSRMSMFQRKTCSVRLEMGPISCGEP